MVQRKINRVGTATLTVSLPSSWTKSFGLKQGNVVEVNEDGSKLVISAENVESSLQKYQLHLKKGEHFLRRYLSSTYRDGFDEIEITSEEPLDFELVKKAVEVMIGSEIIVLLPKRVVVRNVATPNFSEFEQVLSRLFMLNISLAKSVLECMNTGKCVKEEGDEGEHISNKLCLFCQRLLIKKDLATRPSTFNKYLIVSVLEQLADHLKEVSDIASKSKVSSIVAKLFEQWVMHLGEVNRMLTGSDTAKMTSVSSRRKKILDEIRSLYEKKFSVSDFRIAGHLFALVRLTNEIELSLIPCQKEK